MKKIPKEYQWIVDKAKSIGSYKTSKQKESVHRLIELLIKMNQALKLLSEPNKNDKNAEIHLHLHINKI